MGRFDSLPGIGNFGGRREARMAADYSDRVECCCSTNCEDLKRGWEGSAILNHGSLLKFGCISFVFSISKCISPQLIGLIYPCGFILNGPNNAFFFERYITNCDLFTDI